MAASDDGRAASPPPVEGAEATVQAKKAEGEAEPATTDARLSGIVKWFNASKGASQAKRGGAGPGDRRDRREAERGWVNWS